MKKQALIIGFGASGKAAAKLAVVKGYDVLIADKNTKPNSTYKVVSDQTKLDPNQFDIVIVSPGIPKSNALYSFMLKHHKNVVGEASFALSFLSQRCFAITGSNGKTTTTYFLEHLLKTAKKKAVALGNMGRAISEYALNPDPKDLLVCEISSFQLETLEGLFFDAGAILNITPDHLDRYEDFKEYAHTKLRLFNALKRNGKIFMREEEVKRYSYAIDSKKLSTIKHSSSSNFEKIYRSQSSFDRQTLNLLVTLSEYFEVSKEDLLQALQSFKKPSHRLEFVEKISGVSFYNDSKATNLESVIFALNHFSCPIHLIVGGKDKGFDFSEVKEALLKNVKALYAIGEMQEKIDLSLNKDAKVLKVETLDKAVKCAFERAQSNEIVLLSPGCSSYDQFENFESRGNFFKQVVLDLKQRNAQ